MTQTIADHEAQTAGWRHGLRRITARRARRRAASTGRLILLVAALAGSACAQTAPELGSLDRQPEAETPPTDGLADRLLAAALQETEASIQAYERVAALAEETREDAQNRARQRVLEGALAAERGETLLRIRFAMLGAVPNDDEGQLRLYLSFLATAADDLLEADAIDPAAMRRHLPELTGPVREIAARIPLPAREPEPPDAP